MLFLVDHQLGVVLEFFDIHSYVSFFFLFYMHDDGSSSSLNSEWAFFFIVFLPATTQLILLRVFCGRATLTTKRTGSGYTAVRCIARREIKVVEILWRIDSDSSFLNVMGGKV